MYQTGTIVVNDVLRAISRTNDLNTHMKTQQNLLCSWLVTLAEFLAVICDDSRQLFSWAYLGFGDWGVHISPPLPFLSLPHPLRSAPLLSPLLPALEVGLLIVARASGGSKCAHQWVQPPIVYWYILGINLHPFDCLNDE